VAHPFKVGSCNTSGAERPLLPLQGVWGHAPLERFGIYKPRNAISCILASSSALNID